jgi:DNA repair protein RecO (recombination protein O)
MQAIVLQRKNFREHDQIISLYTKEKGKLELLARGVKKITSKNSAHLEPFCLGLIEMVPGKELDHLIKVVPIDQFKGIRVDLEKSLVAGYAVSFLDKMTEVCEPDRKIWELTLEWLKYLKNLSIQDTGNSLNLLDAYIVRLLDCLGLAPVLDRCVVCTRSYHDIAKEQLIISNQRSGLYFMAGGLICSKCILEKSRIGEKITKCGLRDISNLQFLLRSDWKSIAKVEWSKQEKKEVHGLIYEFTLYHSERKIQDWRRILSMAIKIVLKQ